MEHFKKKLWVSPPKPYRAVGDIEPGGFFSWNDRLYRRNKDHPHYVLRGEVSAEPVGNNLPRVTLPMGVRVQPRDFHMMIVKEK